MWAICVYFIFDDPAAPEISTYGLTLSLHDALPISGGQSADRCRVAHDIGRGAVLYRCAVVRVFARAPDFAAGFLARPLEQHQRRVADQLQAVFRNHHAPDLGRPPGRRKTASLDPAKVRLCRPTGPGRRPTPVPPAGWG